jgi:hypothetical protein
MGVGRSAGMRRLLPLATLALAACASSPDPAPAPALDPFAFFSGRTTGSGEIRPIIGRARPVTVESVGRVRPDGVLVVRQRIEEEGRPAHTRRWELRREGLRTYRGTLSDAAGPVTARADGNQLRLSFGMNGGLDADQLLILRPDGRTIDNRMTVSKLGVPVARLRETIRKVE